MTRGDFHSIFEDNSRHHLSTACSEVTNERRHGITLKWLSPSDVPLKPRIFKKFNLNMMILELGNWYLVSSVVTFRNFNHFRNEWFLRVVSQGILLLLGFIQNLFNPIWPVELLKITLYLCPTVIYTLNKKINFLEATNSCNPGLSLQSSSTKD